jgi:hypothetical protein
MRAACLAEVLNFRRRRGAHPTDFWAASEAAAPARTLHT